MIRRSLVFSIVSIALFGALSGALTSVASADPAYIPLDSNSRPSSDLVYQGKPLLPEEAFALSRSGQVDLSNLDPAVSDFWKPEVRPSTSDSLPLNTQTEVTYLGTVASRAGNFRFTATQPGSGGIPLNFTFMLSKRIHNVLYRKALLRKLGYTVPAMLPVRKLRVQFSDRFEKEVFITALEAASEGNSDRWVVEAIGDDALVLQDVVAMDDQDRAYNPAMGFFPSDTIAGRRVISALVIPLSLVEVPESMNLFSWNTGQIESRQLRLDYPSGSEFPCGLDDARWMTKRIAHLTREDWKEIARAAQVPDSVAQLFVEKTISRRDHLVKVFKVASKVQGIESIDFDTKTELLPDLKKGQLTRLTWEGYGSRFTYGDPESPLSNSEVWAWTRSIGISTLIDNAMSQLNNLPGMETDSSKIMSDHQIKLFVREFKHFLETGEQRKVPFGVWAFPRGGIQLLASRDIVTGTYLGTDNLVQLADSVGFNISAGATIGFDGVPSPVGAQAGVEGTYTRTYTHIRPIKSLKAALKYPFKNMAVPLYQRRLGRDLDQLIGSESSHLTAAQRKALVSEVVGSFKKEFNIGESLIVIDSIGAGFDAQGGATFWGLVKAKLSFEASQKVLSRLQIFRASENTIQIYRDFGNSTNLSASVSGSAIVPVITLSTAYRPGTAKTRMHRLNITADESRNPGLVRGLSALKNVLFTQSVELLRSIDSGVSVSHHFKERESRLGLVGFVFDGVNSTTQMTVKNTQGAEKKLHRRYWSRTRGQDFMSLGEETVMNLIGYLLHVGVALPNQAGANPGYTVLGKAFTRLLTFDAVADSGKLEQPYIHLARVWNGWSMTKKKAEKLIHRLNERYGYEFYPDTALNETDKLALYHIDVDFQFYERGLKALRALPSSKVRRIFKEHPIRGEKIAEEGDDESDAEESGKDSDEDSHGSGRFLRLRTLAERAARDGKIDRESKYLLKLISLAEARLSLSGLKELTGGDGGVYVTTRIEGFRKGDENGDTPYVGNSYGEYGSRQTAGPMAEIRAITGMSEAEFLANWLMKRVL